MSPIKPIALWLRRLLATPRAGEPRPDRLSLRDWADLPPHHPLC